MVFIATLPPVKQPVTIRSFEKGDLPGILRIERESFELDAWPREVFLEYAYAPEPGSAERLRGPDGRRAKPPVRGLLEYAGAPPLFLVATAPGSTTGQRLAGYIITCLTRHGGEIASLAVGSRYRQMGVATALLKTILRKLRRRGAKTAWLMVRPQNKSAIRLYRKLGFVRTATVANYYDDRSSGWQMRMNLVTFPRP
jgi:ribosomal protein S18 acetylase RimI-like enzyme